MQASGALRVLDTLVMGTNAEPHSILVQVHRRDLVKPLSLEICGLHGASCVKRTFAIDVCCHSDQVCLGPKDFLDDWWDWNESDNDSEIIDDQDIKE